MLGKLLKYEIKSTARIFLPLYPVILVLALLNKILFVAVDSNISFLQIPTAISVVIYAFMVVAVFVITFIVTIQRFYKNLVGEEGYLMFTLPVKESSLIFSKLIVATMWYIGSILITFISIFIMLPSYDFIKQMPQVLELVNQQFMVAVGMDLGLFFAEILVTLFIGIIVGALMIYAAIAIGHLANRNRILCSFGAFLGLSIIAQTIQMIVISILSKNLFHVAAFESDIVPAGLMQTMLLTAVIIEVILGIGYFFVTKVILSKKLNLE